MKNNYQECFTRYRKELDLLRKELKDNGKKVPYSIQEVLYSYLKCLDENEDLNPVLLYNIINQFISEFPLTPIYDEEKEWNHIASETVDDHDNVSIDYYQSNRRPSLYKLVTTTNGQESSVTFRDMDRADFILYNEGGKRMSATALHFKYQFLLEQLVDAQCPIDMPYMPSKRIKVYLDIIKTEDGTEFLGIPYLINHVGIMIGVEKYYIYSPKQTPKEITKKEFLKKYLER